MMNGDVHVDNSRLNQIDRWSDNDTGSMIAMRFNASCYSLFIDTKNALYCAMGDLHQIGKQANITDIYTIIIVAGNGTNGTESHLLRQPCGIFVDKNFTLYVADTNNHRIQRFFKGELNGTTIAGNGAPGTISLSSPHSIFLDGNGYLFILEIGSHRVVASGPWGFRCVAACSGASGSTSDLLRSPVMLSLNSYGSIFVMDRDNSRIQEFPLARNSCTMHEVTTDETSTERGMFL